MSVVEAAGSAVIDCSGLGSGAEKTETPGPQSGRDSASEGEREAHV